MGEHKRPFNGYTNVIQTMNPSWLLIFLKLRGFCFLCDANTG